MKLSRKRGFGPSGVFFCVFFAFAATACAGTYSGGAGTAEDPYKISTVADWQELIATTPDYDKHFILLNDIDFVGINLKPVAPNTSNQDIFQGTAFTGVFNGNGQALFNAVIDLPDYDCVGLFGNIGESGQVRSLSLKNMVVNGQIYVGGLCGRNQKGTISDCYTTGMVNGGWFIGGLCGLNTGTIKACYTTGNVIGDNDVGGLCGYNQSGILTQCYATGTVSGDRVGGLCGDNRGRISFCYAEGNAMGYFDVGGLCGLNMGRIDSCYAMGSISGVEEVGGLVGMNTSRGDITESYATGSVQGQSRIGGLCGWNDFSLISDSFWDVETSGQARSDGGSGKTTAEMKALSTYTVAAWNFTQTWGMSGEDYPRLLWELLDYGSLQVTILPPEAVSEGAQWMRNGSGQWMDSGQTETEVVPVSWDIIFKQTAHWWKPDQIQVSVSPDEVTQVKVTYRAPGSLQVTLLPPEANEQGARWRRFGTDQWLESGRVETPLLSKDWIVEFKPTPGWVTPDSIEVAVSPDELTRIDVSYAKLRLAGNGTETNPYRISTIEDWRELAIASADWDKHFILLNDIDFGGMDVTPIGFDFGGVFDGRGHVVRNVIIDGHNYAALFANILGEVRNLGVENITVTGSSSVGGLCAESQGTITACYVTGQVTGDYMVGGLCGGNYGTLNGCYATAIVAGDNHSDTLGGLCGTNEGGTIANCYTAGRVTGRYFVGGLCGSNNGDILGSCFWDTQISEQSQGVGEGSSNGVAGKTTGEMQMLSTFTGASWDFVGEEANGTADVWRMCGDGISYPRLSWEFSQGGDLACPDGVAMEDLVYLAGRWMASTPATFGAADANADGRVDLLDMAILSENWGT